MNKKILDLQESFLNKALEQKTLFLLSSDDAIDYVELGVKLGLRLTGVEGFSITSGGAYQPSQEFCNDIIDTSVDYDAFVKSTKELILKGKSTNIYFQVVFDD